MRIVEVQNSMNIFVMKKAAETKSLHANGYKTNNENRAFDPKNVVEIKENIYGIRFFGMCGILFRFPPVGN